MKHWAKMASAVTRIFSITGIALLLNIASASAEGLGLEFNYSDPSRWGSLSPQFALCSSGKHQSPINIVPNEAAVNKSLAPLSTSYHLDNATLLNTGLSIKEQVKGASALVIDGKTYRLLQVHWHTPSEHLLNGVKYAAELHQVHQAEEDGSLAVVGILYKYGKPDRLVAKIQSHLDELADLKHCGDHGKDEIFLRHFDNKALRRRPRRYYRYFGSLTTPPCDENVIWTVMTKVKTMSKEQVASLSDSLCALNKRNARPVQPLNGRKVQLYDGN
ncbi:hypothetical protein Dimus_034756 [Dionaea muscipula]